MYQILLKAISKNTAGDVLIISGHPNGSFAGYFDLPGGRIDVDEFTTPLEQIFAQQQNNK